IVDPHFIQCVKDIISEIRNNRLTRPEPKPGFRYKRDLFDRMDVGRELNSKYFIANIESIWLKRSKLNSEMMNVIKYVCDKALGQTLVYYAQKKAVEAEQQPTE